MFCQKKCEFVKHDENCATHYSLIVQRFAPESTSVHAKKHFEFVTETARQMKQDELNFMKKHFAKRYETPSKARYTLFANMTNRGTKLFFRRIKYCWRK